MKPSEHQIRKLHLTRRIKQDQDVLSWHVTGRVVEEVV